MQSLKDHHINSPQKAQQLFGADVSRNPQAPGSRKGKGHKSRKVAAPPPYAPADVNLVDVSRASNVQQNVPQMTIVPPGTELNLQALNNYYVASMVGDGSQVFRMSPSMIFSQCFEVLCSQGFWRILTEVMRMMRVQWMKIQKGSTILVKMMLLNEERFMDATQPIQDFHRNNHLSHFQICYSHNEDEDGAAASLTSVQLQPHVQNSRDKDDAAANLMSMQLKADDILKKHQKKNDQHHLPDPESLEILHQQTEIHVQHKAPTLQSKAKPTQLRWYGTGWKGFLEDAKGECHTVHALENPSPSLTYDLTHSIIEVLLSVKLAWEQAGKQVCGLHKSNMARLLYDDLATWQSKLKKVMISLALSILGLIPPAEYNCGLLGFEKNGTGKVFPKFTAKEYKVEYGEMLEMMGIFLHDAYHGLKLVKQLQEWATYGWSESLKVDSRGSLEMKHTHLKIYLELLVTVTVQMAFGNLLSVTRGPGCRPGMLCGLVQLCTKRWLK
ncbi:hypothetical protein DFH29DRAFT_871919 [Suillus ampliporus]|nr:hypothetical protein DFH29DRAFT_871919 [Suillus ampliporus]